MRVTKPNQWKSDAALVTICLPLLWCYCRLLLHTARGHWTVSPISLTETTILFQWSIQLSDTFRYSGRLWETDKFTLNTMKIEVLYMSCSRLYRKVCFSWNLWKSFLEKNQAMVNVPKARNSFCAKCNKHVKMKVTQYKKSAESMQAQGRRG